LVLFVLSDDLSMKGAFVDNEVFYIGEEGNTKFGWEEEQYNNFYDKVNWAWLQANYRGDNYKQMINEVIMEHTGAGTVGVDERLLSGYIDHESVGGDNLAMFSCKKTLTNFLFNPTAYIQGGNDNG